MMSRLARWSIAPLLLAACRGGDSADTASMPYAREVAEAVPKIESATGLTFKSPPKVESRSREQVREFLLQRFHEDLPDAELQSMQRTYARFGLLGDSVQLGPLLLDLLSEQVAGYYDPAAKTLYIVEGSAPELIGITVAHELVHALQDQYVNLDSIQHLEGDNDRLVASQAVMEGQATYVQMQTMLGAGAVANLPGGWDRVRDLIRESQGSMPVFAAAPMILQETLLFPYLSGAEFMRRYAERAPDGSLYDALPQSTEQILHEDAYFGTPDVPTRVMLPAASSGSVQYENNLGEFETRLLLYQLLQDQSAAFRGAAGWDGDRYALLELPGGGEALAWVTIWDSAIDAAEFHDLFDTALSRRYHDLRPGVSSTSVRRYQAEGRSLELHTLTIDGRPSVFYVDMPSGTTAAPMDPAAITVAQP